MMTTNEGLTVSDALALGNGGGFGGFGGNDSWWIVLLILLFAGGWNNGFGFGGNNSSPCCTPATAQGISDIRRAVPPRIDNDTRRQKDVKKLH